MKAIQTIQYEDGHIVPIVNQASYLGTTITANGNYHAEISARIAASMTTLKRLDISGTMHHFQKNGNSEYTVQLLPRSYYTDWNQHHCQTQTKRLDAFQNKGLGQFLGIKHAYFSRIRNQQVIATANQEAKPKNNNEIIKMLKQLNKDKPLCSHTYSEPQKMTK